MAAMRDTRYNKSKKGKARNKRREQAPDRLAYKRRWIAAYRKRRARKKG